MNIFDKYLKKNTMKNYLLLLTLLVNSIIFGQVGINTTTPGSTLDITAKNSTGTDPAAEGLLIPRVDRQRAQSMTGTPVSTLIYVNSISSGTLTGTAINIDAVGYYYYNGTVWIKLNAPLNIYTNDGSLNGNRTVTQGSNTLAFNGTAVNAFSVDSNTFSVDAANDRIGIGSTAPTRKLHVEGSEYLNAAVTAGTTKNAVDINIGQDGFGYGNRTDNYGINIRSASSLGTGPVARINFGDTNTSTAGSGKYLSFSVGNGLDELMYLTDNNSGRVGIGSITPASTLDVTAKNATGTSTNVDGILIPRVDRQRAQSMTNVAASTMIYVNDISTGTRTGTAIDIDEVGYYAFNGTNVSTPKWQKFAIGLGASAAGQIVRYPCASLVVGNGNTENVSYLNSYTQPNGANGVINTIIGSSLGTDNSSLTLPAGTYRVDMILSGTWTSSPPPINSGTVQIYVNNQLYSDHLFTAGATLGDVITLNSTSTLQLRIRVFPGNSVNSGGTFTLDTTTSGQSSRSIISVTRLL